MRLEIWASHNLLERPIRTYVLRDWSLMELYLDETIYS